MGVPGFFSWLLRKVKKLTIKNLQLTNLDSNVEWLMLDTNCLLHPCVAYILEKYSQNKLQINNDIDVRKQIEIFIFEKIASTIDDMILKLKPEHIFIAIDGVAPMGKILQQRQRRYKFLYDKKFKIQNDINDEITECIKKKSGLYEPILPMSSIELTPGTDFMERINKFFEKYVEKLDKNGIKYIYSSYHEEGEGEHKILQYIRKYLLPEKIIIIYGLDADLLFLSLGIGYNYNLYIMREKQIFSNKEVDLDEIIEYNFVEIKKLHQLIESLDISTNDFILLCYLIGNDFLPGLITTDIKKGGLDKILTAFNNVKEKFKLKIRNNINKIISHIVIKDESNISNINYKINHVLLKAVFIELLWSEKYIWHNINRDKLLNQLNEDDIDEKEKKMLLQDNLKKINLEKFISGESANTDCLDKIEFSSKNEFYNYYLGTNFIEVDIIIIKKMVENYIQGIEWCLHYYLDECKSWSWGYNFIISPLISDIVKYYNFIKIEYDERKLCPIEQLILAIPPDTYKYVIEPDIIEKIKKEINIGYMIPDNFSIDINKESLYWKCQVRLPIVEYTEYIEHIKKINIKNDNNLIYALKKNF